MKLAHLEDLIFAAYVKGATDLINMPQSHRLRRHLKTDAIELVEHNAHEFALRAVHQIVREDNPDLRMTAELSAKRTFPQTDAKTK